MEEEIIFDFERRIREICEDNQMTRYELMNKAGLKHTSFYNMSNGKLTTPSLVSIKRICEVVDLDLASFFTYRGEGRDSQNPEWESLWRLTNWTIRTSAGWSVTIRRYWKRKRQVGRD